MESSFRGFTRSAGLVEFQFGLSLILALLAVLNIRPTRYIWILTVDIGIVFLMETSEIEELLHRQPEVVSKLEAWPLQAWQPRSRLKICSCGSCAC